PQKPVDPDELDDEPDDAPEPAAQPKAKAKAPPTFLFDDAPTPGRAKEKAAPPRLPVPVPPPAPAVRLPAPAVAPARASVARAPAPRPPGGLRTFGWRCGAIYAVLYCAPFPLDLLPWTEPAASEVAGAEHAGVLWLAQFVGVAASAQPNGSGDTTYQWFQLLC